ncbi:AAA family ATPase [Methanolapillus ohkumae]|uniref:Chromosome partition protein Smc n=1 Tax=Methanolapillus ohkumae TaxID=3028298 RepID=A0AA96ZX14_9EURY|nr:Chromosome partition protein Smc [Methanosarcinaceae archaeon Am2]
MKFKSLHVENIRSYKSLDLDFKDGVTVISGVNGSGKSSILEACFIGLFGTGVLLGTNLLIQDMIRKGSTTAEIVLDFEHKENHYRIEQQFKVQKTGAASVFKSILYKNGEIIAEQAKKTYAALCELLNMDEKNFQNCAYIRQGDIDALINAKPKERQQMIDDLLQLGKLEEYRERTNISKIAVNRLVRLESARQKEMQQKIAEMRSRNLHASVNDRRDTLKGINSALSDLNQQKELAGQERVLLDSKMQEFEQNEKELSLLSQDLAELDSAHRAVAANKDKTLAEISGVEKKIGEIRSDRTSVQSEIVQKTGQSMASSEEFFSDLPSLLLEFKREEKAAYERLALILKELDLISAEKGSLQNQILEKETEFKYQKAKIEAVRKEISDREQKTNSKNLAVESGFSKAQIEKDAFLSIFENLLDEFKKSDEPAPEISGLAEEISFCFGLVRAQDLPIPSDDELWKNLISDMEKLENFILQKSKEIMKRQTDIEAEKAQIEGELGEKKKRILETSQEIQKLEEEHKNIESGIFFESKNLEKILKSVSDFRFIQTELQNKRNDRIRKCPAFGQIVPKSRLDFLEVEPADVEKTYDFVLSERENSVSQKTQLMTEKSEIEKAVAQKEELFKSGKCPTCGQDVSRLGGDGGSFSHLHATEDELKRLGDISHALSQISGKDEEIRSALTILKEIKELDVRLEEIKSKRMTAAAEERGKQEMIEKSRRDLAENEKRRVEKAAQNMENNIFCDTRQKDFESFQKRLFALKSESDAWNLKTSQLTAHQKNFVSLAHEILRNYADLENSKKMSVELETRKSDLETSLSDLDLKTESLRKNMAEISAKEEKIRPEKQFKEAELAQQTFLLQKAERLVSLSLEEDKAKTQLFGLSEKIKSDDALADQYRRQISDKRIKTDQLSLKNRELANFSGALMASKILENTEKTAQICSKIESWESSRNVLLEQIGMLQNEIAQMGELEEESKILRNKIGFLALVLEDVTALEEMYLQIRSDMRSKNIEALDILLNDMFDFIYANNAYSHLELDADYNLKVYEKDGSVLEPKQLSGGERAIFNLALRCAIYRLLSLGFGEDNHGKLSLPPLIFDEPTVFLDSGHVAQLIKLVERMKEEGVGQIIVVSHDESLIDSADQNFRIEKDPLTNASERIVDETVGA